MSVLLAAHAAAATIDAQASGSWSVPTTWSGGMAPGSGDTAVIAAPLAVSLDGDYTVGGLQLSYDGMGAGGTIDGGGSLDILGSFVMESRGWVNNAGGLSLHGASTLGSASVAAPVYFYRNPTVLPVDNYGAANLYTAAGGQQLGIEDGSNTVHWTNHAGSSFTLNGVASIGSNTQSLITNEAGATFAKSGAGTSVVNWSFVNDGALNVTEGKLLFTAVNSSPQYSGSGDITVSPGATLAFNNVTIAGGTSLNGPVTLEGTNFIDGTLNAVAGTLDGTLTGANFTMSGEWTLTPSSSHVNASGTATLQGHLTAGSATATGSVSFYHNPGTMTVANEADVDVLTVSGQGYGITEGSNPLDWNNKSGATVTLHHGASLGSSAVSLFHNQAGATLEKVDTETSTINWSFRNDGSLLVQDGRLVFKQMTWQTGAGSITVSPGASLELNTVTFADGITVDAPVTLTGNATPGNSLTLTNAVLDGLITGGAFALHGNLTVLPNSQINASASVDLYDTVTAGSTSANGYAFFYHNPGSMTVNNHGVVNVLTTAGNSYGITEGSNTLAWNNLSGATVTLNDGASLGSSAASLFHNQAGATLVKVGTGTSPITWSVRNDGAIDVQSGKLIFQSATWQPGSGSISLGAGAEVEFNAMTFADGSSVSVPATVSGQTTVDGSVTFSDATITHTVSGGTYSLHGDLTLPPNSQITATGAVDLYGHVAAGSSSTTGYAFFYRNPGTMTVNNHAAVDVYTVPGQGYGITEGSNTLVWNNLSGSSITLHDGASLGSSSSSVLHLSAGSTLTKVGGEQSLITWSVQNDGTIALQDGALKFSQMTWDVGTGGFSLSSGASLEFNGVNFAANSAVNVAATLTGATTLHDGVAFGGAVSANGATITGSGHVTFASLDLTGGQLVEGSSPLTVSGAVTGNGVVIGNVSFSDGITASGQAVIDQPVNVDGDVATFYSVGQAVIQDDANLGVGGELHSSTGFQFSSSAELAGSGLVDGDVESSGTISAGNSPGKITFDDSLLLNASSDILFELGGTTPVAQYDQIDVDGLLTLAGALKVTFINDFSPSLGDSFDLLDWDSLAGTFASLDLPALGGGLEWNTDQLYITGTIVAVPEPAACALLALAAAAAWGLRRRKA